MFKLKRDPLFFWPVVVKVPVDGGQFETETFDGQFRRLSHTRMEQVRVEVEAGRMSDVQFAREVLAGWRGVTSDGADVPWSETARDQALEVPGCPAAVVRAYLDAVAGIARGN